MKLSNATRTFVLHWGEMGARWGVNRTVAQVHALLYLSTEPMTAEEIAATLTVARSNVSNSLRELQNWNLVQLVHQMGDRRDFFRTEHDLWEMFRTVVEQRVEREIVPTMQMLQKCAVDARNELGTPPEVSKRISAMEGFLGEVHGWYLEMRKLPHTTLRAVMKLGSGVTRWLPAAKKADIA